MNEESKNAYAKNEIDANKQMVYVCLLCSGVLSLVWILYFANSFIGIFKVSKSIDLLVKIILPINIMILTSSFFWMKTDKLKKPVFKYFLIFSFLLVVFNLSIIMPRKVVIAWALPLVLTTHFYNRKFSRIVFISSIIALFVGIYLGMFIGEYDASLLTGGRVIDGVIIEPQSPRDRIEFLHELILQGENRYLTVFLYFYLPMVAILTAIFFISEGLNKRTRKLLIDEVSISNEKLLRNKEMEFARAVQLSVLPETFKSGNSVDIIADLTPAREVGGDFYDYYKLDDNHVAIVIGDVSGKGVPAAMFMMKTITCFKTMIKQHSSPAKILEEVNRVVNDGNITQTFVTVFLGILDLKTGEMIYANAGHNKPLIFNKNHFEYLKCSSGFVLGAMPDSYVKDETLKLKKGDIICLYTDGITEARSLSGDFYGEDRLLATINSNKDEAPLKMYSSIKEDLIRFVNGAEQSDDMTCLILKYKENKKE